MERVDFIEQNEFHIKSRRILGELETPAMIRILLKSGLVKNEKQALLVLLTFIMGIVIITGVLIAHRINPSSARFVMDEKGKTYTSQQYIELVKQGRDPLLPK